MSGKGGARPNSGRKAHLEDKTVEEIVNLSAKTVKQALTDETLPLQFRTEVAVKILVKRMPQVVEGSLEHSHVIEMAKIRANESPLELRIG